jgi:hypothetical protein
MCGSCYTWNDLQDQPDPKSPMLESALSQALRARVMTADAPVVVSNFNAGLTFTQMKPGIATRDRHGAHQGHTLDVARLP